MKRGSYHNFVCIWYELHIEVTKNNFKDQCIDGQIPQLSNQKQNKNTGGIVPMYAR